MKKVFVIIATCLTLSANLYSQCTPGSATGTAGVTPLPDNVTCIEQGVPYDITMQLENFSVIGGLVTVNFARIDSLVNFPCGLTWQPSKLQFAGGETGCIRVSGTTTDPVGQYPLGIYMTVNISALGQSTEQSGEISSLITQLENATGQNLGIDLSYYSRVVAPGGSCPSIDRGINATNLTSSGATCQAVNLSVAVSGNDTICSGTSTTLTATPTNASGTVTYSWSPGGQTTASITVSPTSTTPYSVTATDQNGSATASRTVTVNTCVSVPTNEHDLTFGISPNPSSGILSLEFSAENSGDTYALTVMDLAGKKVFEEKYTGVSGTVQKQLDLSSLPKGTYALQLSSGEGMGIKKLVIR